MKLRLPRGLMPALSHIWQSLIFRLTLAAGLGCWIGLLLASPHPRQMPPDALFRAAVETAPGRPQARAETVSDADAEVQLHTVDTLDKVGDSLAGETEQLLGLIAENPQDRNLWREAQVAVLTAAVEDLPDLLQHILYLPQSQRRDELVLDLIERWAESDPVAALLMAGSLESAPLREDAMARSVYAWSTNDPEGALAWLGSHEAQFSSRMVDHMFTAALDGYADTSLVGAIGYFSGLATDNMEPRLLQRASRILAEALVQQGLGDAAWAYFGSLPEGAAQQVAWSELAAQLGKADPEAGARLLQTEALAEHYEAMTQAYVSAWAEQDPAAAAAWLTTQSEGDIDPGLASSIMWQWARYDLEASGQWLNEFALGSEYDRAVGIYTFHAAREDPASAMTWAEDIADDRRRTFLMRRVSSEWQRQDSEGFEQYLQQGDFSEDEKAILREGWQPRGGGGGRRWGGP